MYFFISLYITVRDTTTRSLSLHCSRGRLDSLAPLCQCAAGRTRTARPSTQRELTTANAYTDEQQLQALRDAIERHEPIDEWLHDEHRGLLSMGDSRLGCLGCDRTSVLFSCLLAFLVPELR